MSTGVYKIENTANGRLYIGSAVDTDRRFSWHRNALINNRHFNRHLQNAWSKYGKQCFEFSLVEVVVDTATLVEREQYYIDKYEFDDLYNIAPNARSHLGITRSEETKRKMSAAQTGKKRKPLSDRHKNALLLANIGRKCSEETRRKIAEANKGRMVSAETKHKISEALKGNTFTEETKRKISEGLKGRLPWNTGKKSGPRSEATKRKISENQKATKRITLDGETLTFSAWAKKTGIPAKTIHRRLGLGWTEKDALTRPVRRANNE